MAKWTAESDTAGLEVCTSAWNWVQRRDRLDQALGKKIRARQILRKHMLKVEVRVDGKVSLFSASGSLSAYSRRCSCASHSTAC